jgi:hypothetical protein
VWAQQLRDAEALKGVATASLSVAFEAIGTALALGGVGLW